MVIWGPNYSLREPGSPEKVDFWTTGFDFRKEAFGGLGQQKWPVEAKQRPKSKKFIKYKLLRIVFHPGKHPKKLKLGHLGLSSEKGFVKDLADQKMASRGQTKA